MKILLVLLALTYATILPANSAQERGLAIAQDAKQRDQGFSDSKARLTMTLYNQQGDSSQRELRIRTLEVENDGDKSLSIFDHPRDIKGTAFLSHTHAIQADDQWLYLPALKRVKRITSRNKSGPFMGSEFAYEDLSSQEVEKYSYSYLRDEDINGRSCFVIERRPNYKHSGYTRQTVWIDQEYYQPLKIVFYDRKDALLKTLDFEQYQIYLGKHWRAGKMHMQNHQTGKSTDLIWHDYQFRNGYSQRDFDRNSLKRAK